MFKFLLNMVFVFVFILLSSSAFSSHFRGGAITWQALSLDNDGLVDDVEVTLKTAWSYGGQGLPTLMALPALDFDHVGDDNVINIGENPLNNGDYTLLTSIYRAKNLDADISYKVFYSSNSRITTLENNSGGNWNIQTNIYLKGGNLAPKIDLPILFEVPQRQADTLTRLSNWTFNTASVDPNADKLRYRLANLEELGGDPANATNAIGLSVNPNTGLITWTDSGALGGNSLYSAGIVAEDVDEAGNIKSKTHVDFILYLQDKAAVNFSVVGNIPESRNVFVDKGGSFSFEITGAEIKATSLGNIKGTLTKNADDYFTFTPGIIGEGLDPGSYPMTFEVNHSSTTSSAFTKSYLNLSFIVPDPLAPKVCSLEGDRTIYSATVAQLVDNNLDASLSDVNNAHFNGGIIKFNVTFADGQYEVLSIQSTGNGSGEVRLDGLDIYYQGDLIGKIDERENGQGVALRINFTTINATIAAVQSLIRSLTYEDRFVLRAKGDRALSLYLEDPDGKSSFYNFYIDIEDHPDKPPAGTGPVESSNRLTLVEGAGIVLGRENLNFSDPDENDTVTLTLSNVAYGQFEYVSNAGLAISQFSQDEVNLGRITFVHDGSENSPAYQVSASDGTNQPTPPSPATINFTYVNDQPPLLTGMPATSLNSYSFYLFTPELNDDDFGDSHHYTVTNLPTWASFDSLTGTISGTANYGSGGSYAGITITVIDSGDLSSSIGPFTIDVTVDSDADGVPDHLDLDDDNDAVPDNQETADGTDPLNSGSFLDSDSDGMPNFTDDDNDNDSVPDSQEIADGTDPFNSGSFLDSDNDGMPNYIDLDNDNDSVPDSQELADGTDPFNNTSFLDSDSDGTPDFTDLDNDNDSVPDSQELIDGTDPFNNSSFLDSDSDGMPNFTDLDNDNDSVPDNQEIADGTDPLNSDSFLDNDDDGTPDFTDDDNDNDGVPDSQELIDGTDPFNSGSFLDSDNDGRPDFTDDDNDNDGVPDSQEIADGTDPLNSGSFLDSDSDGTPDFTDLDNDNDSVPDSQEIIDGTDPLNNSSFLDSDGDGTPDFTDLDNDNDSVPDSQEIADGTDPFNNSSFLDSDGDGTPDFTDLDNDNDSVPDSQELIDGTDPFNNSSFLDSDDDGIPDFTDEDNDNDGVPDSQELIDGTDSYDSNDFLDNEHDGIPDFIDNDDDNDNVPDSQELIDGTDPNNQGNYLDNDADNVPDYIEINIDHTDPYDSADVKDSDHDGEPDYVENKWEFIAVNDTLYLDVSGVGEIYELNVLANDNIENGITLEAVFMLTGTVWLEEGKVFLMVEDDNPDYLTLSYVVKNKAGKYAHAQANLIFKN